MQPSLDSSATKTQGQLTLGDLIVALDKAGATAVEGSVVLERMLASCRLALRDPAAFQKLRLADLSDRSAAAA